MALLVASVVAVDVAADNSETGSRYNLVMLCMTSGALVHWSQKLGYVCSAMTGNMFKLAEIMFKFVNGYDVGGPLQHGEALIFFAIFFSSLVGALSAVFMIKDGELIALYPLLITVPIHLYLAGCFEEWGWLPRETTILEERKDEKTNVDIELGAVQSPIQGSKDGTSSVERSSVSSKDRESSIIFEVCRITEAEIQEVLEIENSYNYRRDKAMPYDD